MAMSVTKKNLVYSADLPLSRQRLESGKSAEYTRIIINIYITKKSCDKFLFTFCLKVSNTLIWPSNCWQGYTIPLDKRLAADGRGLQGVRINENFAKLAEALYIADRKVNI